MVCVVGNGFIQCLCLGLSVVSLCLQHSLPPIAVTVLQPTRTRWVTFGMIPQNSGPKGTKLLYYPLTTEHASGRPRCDTAAVGQCLNSPLTRFGLGGKLRNGVRPLPLVGCRRVGNVGLPQLAPDKDDRVQATTERPTFMRTIATSHRTLN